MDIIFTDAALLELYTTGKTKDKRYRSLPKGVIKGYKKAIDMIRPLKRIEDLFPFNSLDYHRLQAEDEETVRCNDQYRLHFHSSLTDSTLVMDKISLIKISNHYD